MKRALLALVTLLPLLASHADDKLVPLPIELPKPLFIGTPVPVKLPNLETPRSGKRPDFLAPAGAVNLAKGKEVTSSDSEPLLGDLSLITDGDKSGDEGCFVELGSGKQWVQIDLGQVSDLYAILVWHFHSQARVYKGVVVQVSDDPDFLTGVKTLYNNDIDNMVGLGIGKDPAYIETYEGRLIDAKGVKGRYIRLYSAGNTSTEMNHYIEVEVWGKPAA
ncbi:MAG TPA: discoidin domain-containing protein [Chthoniobacterales bacterium]|nr:discoidin domain-containing protein [Chthoniobacterales bacterium]